MEYIKIARSGKSKSYLIKVIFILVIFVVAVIMLGKIDFPSPNKEIKKIISNEKFKIVK